MTPEQRSNLIGAILIGIAILQLIPVLPSAIYFIKTSIQYELQGQKR